MLDIYTPSVARPLALLVMISATQQQVFTIREVDFFHQLLILFFRINDKDVSTLTLAELIDLFGVGWTEFRKNGITLIVYSFP